MANKPTHNTSKTHVADLVYVLEKLGVQRIMLSPGSRSAPLVIALERSEGIECMTITDERCAAFFALGVALARDEAVGMVCTSGSAPLNYSPALAEAFYQHVPLIALTADRPNEWIDQGENQSINQTGIYSNFIKASFQLPVEVHTQADRWYSSRMVSQAINTSQRAPKGPVHINIPLREPLYDLSPYDNSTLPKVIEEIYPTASIDATTMVSDEELASLQGKRISIILGSHSPSNTLKSIIEEIATRQDVLVTHETLANVTCTSGIALVDPLIEYIHENKAYHLLPDLVITMGNAVVSKKLKFLFKQQNIEHWHITPSPMYWDRFQSLTKVIVAKPSDFLHFLDNNLPESNSYSEGKSICHSIEKQCLALRDNTINQVDDSVDYRVYQVLSKHIQPKTNIFWGNSTPVRYAGLFVWNNQHHYGNRGVSGIDGQVSTAVGFASQTDELCLCVTGDLAMLYDSNALWQINMPANFRLLVIDNGGGNIFNIIPGPDKHPSVNHRFTSPHNVAIHQLLQALGVESREGRANQDTSSLNADMEWLLDSSKNARGLVVHTDGEQSAAVLKQYFAEVKNLQEKDH